MRLLYGALFLCLPNYPKNELSYYTSKRFKAQFESILNDLSELGYTNYWKVLNAKDYGIPQKIPLMWKLKDFLEDEVDEKYYLSEKGIGRLIKKNNKLLQDNKNPNVSSCIVAGYHKIDGRNNQYISGSANVERIGGLYDNENRTHQAGSVYNSEGLSPTLTTMANGGNKQPFVLVREGTKQGYSKAKMPIAKRNERSR